MKLSPVYRALAEQELRRRKIEREIKGQLKREAIPPEMTFREWCESLAEKGLKVDGKPFRLDDRAALIPIYDAIPSTVEEAKKKTIVIMKATQLGLTVWEILANIYLAIKFAPVTIGMFMPSQYAALHKSEHRFMRIVRSAKVLYDLLTQGKTVDGRDKKVGEGNVMTRRIGESLLVFLWTSGKITTESIPMDIVSLDEVQEMTLTEIDKVRKRCGDSDIQLTLLLSTANMPDVDIDYWYQLGDRQVWHTECPYCLTCSDLSDPAGIFPAKSIAYNTGQIVGAPLDYIWTCPECGGWIKNPQQGRYIATNPGAKIASMLLPRTVSPKITAREMIEEWGRAKTGDQKKDFYNRVLARPYIDADQLPVTMAHCLAAAEEGVKLGLVWETSARDTYMGIDQMGSFNAVIIKKRLPDGRQGVVHVEAVFDLDPFERCAEMMKQYGVALCVVEQLPNVNDARKFMNRFPGRVFLAGYADLKDDMMVWGDDMSRSDRKTQDEDRSRYTVTLNQYKVMQTALFRVRDKYCLFPDPAQLEQDVIDNGQMRRIPILSDWVFLHLTKVALVVEQSEEERKPRGKVKKLGIDPHFAFANMLCDVAWARSHGNSMFIYPEAQETKTVTPEAVTGAITQLVEEAMADHCGSCTAYADGFCSERRFAVRPADPACWQYLSIEE
jgi:hypothetical protein